MSDALAVSSLAIFSVRCVIHNEMANERIAKVKETTAIYSVPFQPHPIKNAASMTAIERIITLPTIRANNRFSCHHKRSFAFIAVPLLHPSYSDFLFQFWANS